MEPSSVHPLDQDCACGSGKKAGTCCNAGQPCKCDAGKAAGKTAGECCYKQ